MKRFLVKLMLFFVLVFGLAWGVDYSISKGLLEMEDYRFMSWHDMLQGGIDADVVIMGNSRALSHFEPWTIDSICGTHSYNLGLGGYAISVEILKYHCYRLHNKKPRYIIQQVDYHTLRSDFAPHQHESEQFLPLIYDKGMHKELLRVGYKPLDVFCPLYRYFGYQMVIKNGFLEFFGLKHYVNNPSRQGHHYEEGQWDGTELAKMESIVAKMDQEGKNHFEEYMKTCHNEGIKVVLVNSPTYIGATEKTVGLDVMDAYFDSIANRYGTVYLDYTKDYELCYDTLNFCVSVHLNPQATHRFSVDFALDLKRIIN